MARSHDMLVRDLAEMATFSATSPSPASAEEWLRHVYAPLCARGLFLPPLFAYEVAACAERDGSTLRSGPHELRRQFLRHVRAWFRASVASPRFQDDQRRRGSTLDLLSTFSSALMAAVDVHGLREHGRFVADSLVSLEAARCRRGHEGAASALDPSWQWLDEAISAGRYDDLWPPSEGIAFTDRRPSDVDPFLLRLLDMRPADPAPRQFEVRGLASERENARRTLQLRGEFARMEQDSLPEELGRLAPIELLYLYRASTRGDGDEKAHSQFRTLFLLRTVNGELWQRFAHDTERARTQPRVHLQIDLLDAPRNHELRRAPGTPLEPLVSWYRALAVELAHQVAVLAESAHWNLSTSLHYASGAASADGHLPPSAVPLLASGSREALRALCAACPGAFLASRRPGCRSPSRHRDAFVDASFWIRIVLGKDTGGAGVRFALRQVRSADERGVRVERLASGGWGVATSDACTHAHLLEIDWDRAIAPPWQAAADVLGAVFNPDGL